MSLRLPSNRTSQNRNTSETTERGLQKHVYELKTFEETSVDRKLNSLVIQPVSISLSLLKSCSLQFF